MLLFLHTVIQHMLPSQKQGSKLGGDFFRRVDWLACLLHGAEFILLCASMSTVLDVHKLQISKCRSEENGLLLALRGLTAHLQAADLCFALLTHSAAQLPDWLQMHWIGHNCAATTLKEIEILLIFGHTLTLKLNIILVVFSDVDEPESLFQLIGISGEETFFFFF